jgi:Ca-activated chloride channel family protein
MQRRRVGFLQRSSGTALLVSAILAALIPIRSASTESLGLPAATSLPTEPLVWLELVAPLITESETAVFRALQRDYQRQAFIDRFWQERDPFPETGRNEFLETWQERLVLAQERFGNLQEDRAETMLLAGPPHQILVQPCPRFLDPMEIWLFEASYRHPEAFALVFVHDRGATNDSLVHWTPGNGLASLGVDPAASAPSGRKGRPGWARDCRGGTEVYDALTMAVDWDQLKADGELVPEPSSNWAPAFLSRSTDLPSDASLLSATVHFEYPGRHQHLTVVQALMTIPLDEATAGEVEGEATYAFQVDGEVIKDDRLLESFRYRFDFPKTAIPGDGIPLVIQRFLRPQVYRIAIRIEDLSSNRLFRDERDLEVPALPYARSTEQLPATNSALRATDEIRTLYAESDATLGSGEHSLKLLTPSNELHTDRLRVEAAARGESIAKVTFILNGKPVMSKTRPPFSVEIDLGPSPRLHTLEAVALDETGDIVARDRIPINAGPHRFAVRLLAPQPGERFASSLRAMAEVDLPQGEVLDRVEFYLDTDRLATLYQSPYAQPLALPQHERITYVRAVAYLHDGNSAEDLVFINTPKQMDHLRINFVELYTSVADRTGSPVEGLQKEDFHVFEEGVAQDVRRFERVRDLPIHAGILLDTSTSMAEELSESMEAALRFFEDVVTSKDRAAVVVFNDEPRLVVPFTSNHQILAGGLVDLEAEGETALFDSLVYALHYFSGIQGKRALIVLSDGEDSSSHYSFDEALEFAQRSGVAIYSVGLGLPTGEVDSRLRLQRFAAETGGRYFFISDASQLATIYESIEQELRFQYLLAYQSTDSEGENFRTVEVRVSQPGLEATTVPGYYP